MFRAEKKKFINTPCVRVWGSPSNIPARNGNLARISI